MALTEAELRRISNIETALNNIQTAINNTASKRELKALLAVLKPQITQLEEEIEQLELTGSGGALQTHKDDPLAHDELDSRYYVKADDPLEIEAQVNVASGLNIAASTTVGTSASFVDFPYARVIISNGDTGKSSVAVTGLVAEAVTDGTLGSATGVLAYGVAHTGKQGIGIFGLGLPHDTTDAANAIGVMGFAAEPHSGGKNVAFEGAAVNGSSNYLLYSLGGDIYTGAGALDWDLKDNDSAALSFDTTDHVGLLVLDTTNGSEQIRIGDTASGLSCPYTRVVISQADSGYPAALNHNMGLVVENSSLGSSTDQAHGIYVITEGYDGDSATGITAMARPDSSDSNLATFAIRAFSIGAQQGSNTALYVNAANGVAGNNALYINGGDVYAPVDNQWLIGANASVTDFPNARVIVSREDSGDASDWPIALAVEAKSSGAGDQAGALYAVAATNGADGAFGAVGYGIVTASADTGAAYGLVGSAFSVHSGGENIGVACFAAGSSVGNFCLDLGGGDIRSVAAALDWDLVDNNAAALSFDTTDHAGLLVFDTTNNAEQVRIGNTASSSDFPDARMIVSHDNTGFGAAIIGANTNFGLVAESSTHASGAGAGIYSVGRVVGTTSGTGVIGLGWVEDSAKTGPAGGGYFLAVSEHAGGSNIGATFYAANGANNYAVQVLGGDVEATVDNQWRIGANASATDFPYARMIVSQSDTGIKDSETFPNAKAGIVSEVTAGPSAYFGFGVHGIAKTSGEGYAIGIVGDAVAGSESDTGECVGMAGYSSGTHAGLNVGVRAAALGSPVGNYGLQLYGDIDSNYYGNGPGVNWDLADNVASGLSFNSTDHRGLLVLDTTDGQEQVRIGNLADKNDALYAKLIVSNGSGWTGSYGSNYRLGILAEANSVSGTATAIGSLAIGRTDGNKVAYGSTSYGWVTNSTDTGAAIGTYSAANMAHDGDNIACLLSAIGGTENYALYFGAGDIYASASIDWDLADNTASGLSFDAPGKAGILSIDTRNNAEGIETTGYFKAPKVQLTPEGGIAVKMTNKTGAVSIKGTVVEASSSVDNAVEISEVSSTHPIGVIYENGIADGAEVWVVISGIAQVLIKDSTAATRGYWAKTADVAGRADITVSGPPGADPTHWQEIGHSVESAGSGTDVLVKVVLHFN